MKVVIIVPARLESARFPRKLIADLHGKPVLLWTLDALQDLDEVDQIITATDSSEIQDLVTSYGGHVIRTSADHLSGTDRCAEAASHFDDDTVVINVQGDEPFINPSMIRNMIDHFMQNPHIDILTGITRFTSEDEFANPNNVKVVKDRLGRALYFSRSPIPYNSPEKNRYKHIGVYGFRKKVLMAVSILESTELEKIERLEQLRWLDHGYDIHTIVTDTESISIDTEEDLLQARQWITDSYTSNL